MFKHQSSVVLSCDVLRKPVFSVFRCWPGYKNPISSGRHRNDNISYLFSFFSQWIYFWILVNTEHGETGVIDNRSLYNISWRSLFLNLWNLYLKIIFECIVLKPCSNGLASSRKLNLQDLRWVAKLTCKFPHNASRKNGISRRFRPARQYRHPVFHWLIASFNNEWVSLNFGWPLLGGKTGEKLPATSVQIDLD